MTGLVIFGAKLVLLWLLVLVLRWAFEFVARRLVQRPVIGEFLLSEERALTRLWCQYSWGEISRRTWLVRLGLVLVTGTGPLLLCFPLIYEFGIHGALLDLNSQILAREPAEWIYWLGDSQWIQLVGLLGFGFALTVLTNRPYLATIVGLGFVFVGLLSVPGVLLCILGERLATRILYFFFFRDRTPRWDLELAALARVLVAISSLWWARSAFLVLASSLELSALRAPDRFLLASLLVLGALSVETGVALVFFHFHFGRSRDEKILDRVPKPALIWWGWLSLDLRPVLMMRAAARYEELLKVENNLDQIGFKSGDQIPAGLIQRLRLEKAELRKILRA